jgi:hypothetical protein
MNFYYRLAVSPDWVSSIGLLVQKEKTWKERKKENCSPLQEEINNRFNKGSCYSQKRFWTLLSVCFQFAQFAWRNRFCTSTRVHEHIYDTVTLKS